MKFSPAIFAYFFTYFTIIVFSTDTSAQTAEERGLEISKEADRRDSGFQDFNANLIMVLSNAHGDQTDRFLKMKVLEKKNDGDKSFITFKSPGDIAGTAFLSHTHKKGPDDQWLFLPGMGRVKRIAQSNKSGPFVGSEFAYEDISSQEIEKYHHKYIKNDSFDQRDHFIVERRPVDSDSGYTRMLVWIDTERYLVWKVDYFDRKNTLLKTMLIDDYQQYLDRFWRPDIQVMVNHQTGKSTALHWSNYEFINGLNDSDFTKQALSKAR